MTLLTRIEARSSAAIHPDSIAARPQIIEVDFVANPTPTAGAITSPVSALMLHGGTELATNLVTWRLSDNADRLASLLRTGGRLGIRIHAGHLIAADGRPFSAALDAATGVRTLKGPGGVHETWLFVVP